MVNLQSEFIKFHEAIKLSDENDTLRQKREILLNKLRQNISEEAASYTHFNQGSYAMGTGIKPDDGDYDIDVGLKFQIKKEDYEDPVQVKKWVYNALAGHTKKVQIRRSCVTVTYQEDGEAAYHVDFAVYAANNTDGKLYIAKGKENSSADYRYWEESDPQALINLLHARFTDADDRKQFRRIIRYAKKWKSRNFDLSGNGAPTGIALTALAYTYFNPSFEMDFFPTKKHYDDFTAFKNLMIAIRSHFYRYTIRHCLPVKPSNDLFEKMTEKQQNDFYNEIETLISKLEAVENEGKKSDACKVMTEIFGEDFPVTVEKSYVGTSESA